MTTRAAHSATLVITIPLVSIDDMGCHMAADLIREKVRVMLESEFKPSPPPMFVQVKAVELYEKDGIGNQ